MKDGNLVIKVSLRVLKEREACEFQIIILLRLMRDSHLRSSEPEAQTSERWKVLASLENALHLSESQPFLLHAKLRLGGPSLE